jgi:hypothetical protein
MRRAGQLIDAYGRPAEGSELGRHRWHVRAERCSPTYQVQWHGDGRSIVRVELRNYRDGAILAKSCREPAFPTIGAGIVRERLRGDDSRLAYAALEELRSEIRLLAARDQ